MRWAGYIAYNGEIRNAYNILVGKAAGTRPLKRPRNRWEDNITMDLNRNGGKMSTVCIWLRIGNWWALVNSILNLWVP